MKTSLNQVLTLEQLNEKSNTGYFSHRILRAKLISENHYDPSKHLKGKMYFETEKGKIHLMCAYADLNGNPVYVPMLCVEINRTQSELTKILLSTSKGLVFDSKTETEIIDKIVDAGLDTQVEKYLFNEHWKAPFVGGFKIRNNVG